MDLNKGAFPDERFDIIFNEAALHHISDLEHLLAECQKVCSPHTVFINHDYVGPNHHQWTKKQLSYINKILSLLPPEFRRSLTNPGAIHERKSALSMSQMLKIDPTEGVRAEDTVRVMKQFFDVSDFKPFGGTILHMLLNDMAGNFIAPEHEPLVNMLVLLEESLIDEGALTSDFAYWIATPK
jgi:SAM-dependent methyltransferase